MPTVLGLLSLALLTACLEAPPGPLVVTAGRVPDAATRAALADAPTIARTGARSLVALPAPTGPANSDVQQSRAMAVLEDGALRVPAEPVLGGALLEGGAAWVTARGTLVVNDVEVDRGVIPELDTRGSLLAYAKEAGDDAGVYVFDGRAIVKVSTGLGFADRPRFINDGSLVIIGARPSGIAGVWVARIDGSPPTPVTNASLRTGRPLGPDFVPPPAWHESMHIDGKVLTYNDGAQARTVVLP